MNEVRIAGLITQAMMHHLRGDGFRDAMTAYVAQNLDDPDREGVARATGEMLGIIIAKVDDVVTMGNRRLSWKMPVPELTAPPPALLAAGA